MSSYREIAPSIEQEMLQRVTITEASRERQAQVFKYRKMRMVPQAEYHLYHDICQTLGMASLRMVFVLGVRVIYLMWRDERFREALLHTAAELRRENLDAQMRGEHKQHHYDPLLPL